MFIPTSSYSGQSRAAFPYWGWVLGFVLVSPLEGEFSPTGNALSLGFQPISPTKGVALENSHPKELCPAQLRHQSSEQQEWGPGSVLTQTDEFQGMMLVTLEGRRSKGISSEPSLEWETETHLYRDSIYTSIF